MEDIGTSLSLGAAPEEIVPFASNLGLFENLAAAQHICFQSFRTGLDGASAGQHRPLQILFPHSAGTEHVSIGKVLGGHIINREFGQEDSGSGMMNLLKLVIENVLLSIHDC